MNKYLSLLIFALSPAVFAAPNVSIQTEAFVEKEVIGPQGDTQIQRVPVEQVDPGTELIFELNINNSGDQAATSLKIDNPIPQGTEYVPDSQAGNAELLVSWDNEEFLPEAEFIEGELSATDIKYLRWTLESLNANSNTTLEFRVTIK